MARIVDQALVLRTWDFSEASQTVALLTREHGLVRGLAKGSKRTSPSAKFGGGFELLTQGEVVALQRPEAELASVIEWDLQQVYWGARRSLGGLHAGLYAADLAYHTVLPRDPHPGLFEALVRLLSRLEDEGGAQAALLEFQWQLLSEIGYRPKIEESDAETVAVSAGGWSRTNVWRFDAQRGTVERAGGPAGEMSSAPGWRVRGETVRVLAVLDAGRSDGAEGSGMGLDGRDSAAIERAGRLLAEYLRVLMDRDLPTRALVYAAARGRGGGSIGNTDLSPNGS